ncbi:hypothetical protein BGZ72_000048 [Mortierella alpina]|nr:hypothetical protein BGZ72_000048 [Mortierella alpina]
MQKPSIPSLPSVSPAWCDQDGWGPVAKNRISFTPCFQDTALFGISGLLATISFLLHARHLKRHGVRHVFGPVRILHWPAQVALVTAVLVLLNRVLFSSSIFVGSEIFGLVSLILAWTLALNVNRLQAVHEIRSSSAVLLFELYSLLVILPRMYTLHSQRSALDDSAAEEHKFMSTYCMAILIAFIFDSFPRGWTRMQRESRLTAYDKANIFSRLTFHFVQPVVTKGYHQPLKLEDIQDLMPEALNTLSGSYQRLAANWDAHLRAIEAENRRREAQHASSKKGKATKLVKKTPSLLWVTFKTYFSPFMYTAAMQASKSVLQFASPMLLQQILIHIDLPNDPNDPRSSREAGIALALCLLLVNVVVSMLLGQVFGSISQTAITLRSSYISLIYRKAMVLSPGARKTSTVGEIVNHMSTDAEKLNVNLIWAPLWFSLPIEISLAVFLLYRLLGWSTFCGLGMILVITPIQAWAGGVMENVKEAKMEAQDKRVRLMTEILANIKIIKLYSYIEAFQQKITAHRNQEVAQLRKAGFLDAFLNIAYSCLPLMMAFVSFTVYAMVGGPGLTPGEINAQIIFVSITLFSLINRPLSEMTYVFEAMIAVRVAIRRIQAFLLKEEMDGSALLHIPDLPNDTSIPVIQLADATLAWDPEAPTASAAPGSSSLLDSELATETTSLLSGTSLRTVGPILVDINLSIERSSLTAIVGRVGQGKSSLLSAMIGEMYKRTGSVKTFGSIAYVPQQAWIINATLRDNIIFGKPFNQEKYDRILFASGLLPDLEMFANGSETEIGERGINMSGGQKQRISLARAAYQDADIYLLDDPLSAVDAHVDQHLWQHLIGPSGLLNNKTRVLVTHGVHHLEYVDRIVVIKDGRITESGAYKVLMKAKKAFYQLIKDYSVAHKNKNKKRTPKAHKIKRTHLSPDDAQIRSSSASTTTSLSDDGTEGESVVEVEEVANKAGSSGDLIEEEELLSGAVRWNMFKIYCKAMSYKFTVLAFSLLVVWEIAQLSVPIWLGHWSEVFETTEKTVFFFLGVYACLVVVFMAIDVCLNIVLRVKACLRASTVLHNDALERVVRLPMSFFDATPQGRILNRFSSDVSAVDEEVPQGFFNVVVCAFNLIGNLIVVSIATPVFILILPPLVLLYWTLQTYFIRTSSILKRLEGINKSPIYQQFTESLHGASSIRAMHLQDRFIHENARRIDQFANAHYAWAMTNRWLNTRLEALTALTVLVSATFSVLNKGTISSSMVGLSLSFTLMLVDFVIWFLRLFCLFQGNLVSVERVHEYTVKNTEAPLVTGVPIPAAWPDKGHIVFKNYSTRYREGMDLVLKNISFEVKPSEKVGIVGRTGAGKSSLTLALFRIIEAADSYWARASEQEGAAKDRRHLLMTKKDLQDGPLDSISTSRHAGGGSIEIDGIDISTLGLRDLRKHLAIIPQDPTLFAGTIRDNLDPFTEMEDAELWLALERAHLKDHISSLPGGLSFEVSQSGENFSVGQRSLICLARALLRKTKILILDEATAAVDVETDELIQRTIREEFKDRSILTIAHRIKTVMDSDRILVLEKGRVEEYDAPKALLKQKQGLFYSLAEQAGEIREY